MEKFQSRRAKMAKPDLSVVRPLPLRVAHKPHETAYSLLCRLAARNGNKSVRHLLQRVPNMSGFVSNLSLELEISLAALLSGSDRNKIALSTPLPGYRLGNYEGSADGHKFKICALCLADDTTGELASERDSQAYVRDFWHFSAIKHCMIHSVPMSATCKECQSEFSRKTLFGSQCICEADVRLIRSKKVPQAEWIESWNILRKMGWLPEMPYWKLGRDRYPSNISWALTDAINIEYSDRQLMLMGPQLLQPRFKKAVWDVDPVHFFQAAAKIL